MSRKKCPRGKGASASAAASSPASALPAAQQPPPQQQQQQRDAKARGTAAGRGGAEAGAANGVALPSRPSLSSSGEFYDVAFKVMLVGDSGVGKTCLLVRFKDGAFLAGSFISTVGIDFRNKVLNVDGVKVKLQIWDTAGQERFRSVTHAYYRDAHALLLLYDVTNRASFDNIQERTWFAIQQPEVLEVSMTIRQLGLAKPPLAPGDLSPPSEPWKKVEFHLWKNSLEWCSLPHPFSASGHVGTSRLARRPLVSLKGERVDLIDFRKAWLTEIQEYAKQDVVLMLLGNKVDSAQERVVKREDGEKLAKEYGVPFMETSAKSGLNVDLAFTAIAKELKHRSMKLPNEPRFKLHDYVKKEVKGSGCCRS